MLDDDERGFLSENWAWILVPALIVLGVAAWLMLSGDDGGGGFNYGGF